MAVKCQRCPTLCTPASLREATYEKSQHMIVTEQGSFIPFQVAEREGIDGRETWVRKEVSKLVCEAELRRGKYAHTSTVRSGAWSRRG